MSHSRMISIELFTSGQWPNCRSALGTAITAGLQPGGRRRGAVRLEAAPTTMTYVWTL